MHAAIRIASALAALLALCPAAAPAQSYPDRPIRFIVPFGPGGATDIVARSLGQKLAEAWGQPVVVDNRGGAGGIIGTDLVAKATPDGYTLLLATAANAANVVMEPKLPFDLLKDFAPVTHVVNVPFVLTVNPKVPATSVKDLVALARAKPGGMTYGTVGIGTSNHLMMELVKSLSKTDILHVPYKGVGPAIVDLMAGRLDMMLFSIGAARPYLQDGRLRAIGVTTAKRAAALPDVPAIAEALPGYDMTPWYGILAPARTPKAAIDRLHAETVRILKLPDIQDNYFQQGFIPVGSTPQQFTTHIVDNIAKLRRVVRDANIKPQ
jgi:tripartite-type tricarboxylate transporter receptor subunit TctC